MTTPWWRVPRPFWVVIGLYVLSGVALSPALAGQALAAPLPYGWHKALHVFGAVLFVGNIVVTGFWMTVLGRTGDEALLRRSCRWVSWADVFFTAPGFLLLAVNGAVMAPTWGGVYAQPWLLTSILLLGGVGVLATGLMPVQMALWWRAEDGSLDDVKRLLRWWGALGIAATVVPFVILWLMVAKPALWSGG